MQDQTRVPGNEKRLMELSLVDHLTEKNKNMMTPSRSTGSASSGQMDFNDYLKIYQLKRIDHVFLINEECKVVIQEKITRVRGAKGRFYNACVRDTWTASVYCTMKYLELMLAANEIKDTGNKSTEVGSEDLSDIQK